MKIPTLFLFSIAVAAATNLRNDEPVGAVPNDMELAVDKSLPEESVFRGLLEEVTDPESRELWSGDGYRRYKRSRNRNKSSSSRSSRKGRRSRSRNRDTKLVIIKDDNSRSTSNCVDDIEYWFEDDFDDVDITRSDRNARSGDIVVIVDGDVDCDDLR